VRWPSARSRMFNVQNGLLTSSSRQGIPADEQRLTLGGISLADELTLDECRVDDESTLYVLLDLEGGGKKRKKKNYSTPKKNKHKHKKVKLAVLKYYKVNHTTNATD
jgi:ubiquitin-small subunit ribosomal protein S27Ae